MWMQIFKTFLIYCIAGNQIALAHSKGSPSGLSEQNAQQSFGLHTEVAPLPYDIKSDLKISLEKLIQQTLGVPVLCKDHPEDCVVAYRGLLALDWKGKTQSKKFLVDLISPSRITPTASIYNPKDSSAFIESVFGVRLKQDLQPLREQLRSLVSEAREANVEPCELSRSYYDELFKEDEVRITVVRGYFDNPPDASYHRFYGKSGARRTPVPTPIFLKDDETQTQLLVRLLRDQNFALMHLEPSEIQLTKTLIFNGRRKQINVRILRATIPCKSEANQSHAWRKDDDLVCEEQRQATLKAKAAWESALSRDQIVIYNGHSRYGNGPDFGPLVSKQGLSSFLKLNPELATLDGKHTLLMMGSCSSVKHFSKKVAELNASFNRNGALSLIGTSGDSIWENLAQETSRLIAMLLEGKCLGDIPEIMNLPKIYANNYSYRLVDRPPAQKK